MNTAENFCSWYAEHLDSNDVEFVRNGLNFYAQYLNGKNYQITVKIFPADVKARIRVVMKCEDIILRDFKLYVESEEKEGSIDS